MRFAEIYIQMENSDWSLITYCGPWLQMWKRKDTSQNYDLPFVPVLGWSVIQTSHKLAKRKWYSNKNCRCCHNNDTIQRMSFDY